MLLVLPKEELIDALYLFDKLLARVEELQGGICANQLASILRLVTEYEGAYKLTANNAKALRQCTDLLNRALTHPLNGIRKSAESLYAVLAHIHQDAINP